MEPKTSKFPVNFFDLSRAQFGRIEIKPKPSFKHPERPNFSFTFFRFFLFFLSRFSVRCNFDLILLFCVFLLFFLIFMLFLVLLCRTKKKLFMLNQKKKQKCFRNLKYPEPRADANRFVMIRGWCFK